MSNFKKYLNVYEFDCVLPGSGKKLKYKPITTHQIKKLLVYENEQSPIEIEKAFDDLITSCVVDEDFNIDDIYLQDRHFLIIELRKASKGETYEFQFKCPKCKSDNLTGVDLSKFKVVNKPTKIKNKIQITDDIELFVDFITRGEQKKAYESINGNLTGSELQAEIMLANLCIGLKSIKTPDGKEDLTYEDAQTVVDSLTFKAFEDLKN